MQLADLLTAERIRVPLEVRTVDGAFRALLTAAGVEEGKGETEGTSLSRLKQGRGGTLLRISSVTLMCALDGAGGERSFAALGVSPTPLEDDPGAGDPGAKGESAGLVGSEGDRANGTGLQILLVLRVSRSSAMEIEVTGEEALTRLGERLRDSRVESRILEARDAEDILGIDRLMETELTDALRVHHIMVPLSYRVFSDTPLDEVVDLMARKELRAVPVVGKDLEVLGMVTAGEALKHALQWRGRPAEAKEGGSIGTVREVMSRAVMCVAEDQPLLDAAQLMVNKNVGQLPVVREGEIVGILTRDAVLKALFGEHPVS